MNPENLTQELLAMPERIKNQTLEVYKATQSVEKYKNGVELMKAPHLQAVLNNKELSNQGKRDLALEELLLQDKDYQQEALMLKGEEHRKKLLEIELEYMHNQFRAYLAIAGMGARV